MKLECDKFFQASIKHLEKWQRMKLSFIEKLLYEKAFVSGWNSCEQYVLELLEKQNKFPRTLNEEGE